MGPTAAMLPGDRLHLRHGPIDLVIGAEGPLAEVKTVYRAARDRFQTILPTLVEELAELRRPVEPGQRFDGPVARRMARAILRHSHPSAGSNEATESNLHSSGLTRGPVIKTDVERLDTNPPRLGDRYKLVKPEGCRFGLDQDDPSTASGAVFVTPMAAVAGSVADEVLDAMRSVAPDLQKIWVNNGGDIAIHLSGDATFEAAMVADPATGHEAGRVTVRAGYGIGGIATSGRHGRSLSLGIADAVTVLAKDAAAADVAATLIANAVNLPGHPAIRRAPANEIDPDSDLGERLVVVEVGVLSADEIEEALERGLQAAEAMVEKGHVQAANLTLAGRTLAFHPVAPDDPEDHTGVRSAVHDRRQHLPRRVSRTPEYASQIGGDHRRRSHALT